MSQAPSRRSFQGIIAWMIAGLGSLFLVLIVVLTWTDRTLEPNRSNHHTTTTPNHLYSTHIDQPKGHSRVRENDPGRIAFRKLAVAYLACFGLPRENEGTSKRWEYAEATRLRADLARFSGAQAYLIEMLEEDAWKKPHETWHLMEALRSVATQASLPLALRLLAGDAPYNAESWRNARIEAIRLLLDLREPLAVGTVVNMIRNNSLPDHQQLSLATIQCILEARLPDAFDIFRNIVNDPTIPEDVRRSSFNGIVHLGTLEATQYILDGIVTKTGAAPHLDRTTLHRLAEHADDLSKEMIRFRILSEDDPSIQSSMWGAVAPHIDGSADLAGLLADESNPKRQQRAVQTLGAIGTRKATELLLLQFAKAGSSSWLREEIADAIPERGLDDDLFESLRGIFLSEMESTIRRRLAAKLSTQLTRKRATSELVHALRRELQLLLLQSETHPSYSLVEKIVDGLSSVSQSTSNDMLQALDRASVQPSPSQAGLVGALRPLRTEPHVITRLQAIASKPSLPTEWRSRSVEILTTPDVFKTNQHFISSLYESEQDEELSYLIVMRSLDLKDPSFLLTLQERAERSSQPFRQGEAKILKEMIPILSLLKDFSNRR